MKIGSSAAAGSFNGSSSRLKSINLRPVVGPANGSESSSESSAQPDQSTENTGQSLIPGTPDSNPSSSSPGSSQENFPFYDPQGGASGATVPEASESSDESSAPSPASDLSPAEQRKVQELKRIDSRVRSHEQAHLAAAGSHAQGGISFEYVQGPDGQRYAVGGEVQLDASKASTPEETVEKLRRVKAAALAPANPSPQDLQIASQASRKLAEAQAGRSDSGESPDAENNDRPNESSGESTDSTERNTGDASSAADGFEGPNDIGVDVNEDVGTFIADRTGSTDEQFSGASRSNSEVQGQNGSGSTAAATYGPELNGPTPSPNSGGFSSRGQSLNVLI